MTEQNADTIIPALRYNFLTPFYDWVLRVVMRESAYKEAMIPLITINQGGRILDAGCGTGTLTVMLKKHFPHVEVVGLDGDRNVLQIANSKVLLSGDLIQLDHGFVTSLPYSTESFDACVCSLVIHHLTTANKQKAFLEFYRILKPGGTLYVIDFFTPHNIFMMAVTLITQFFEETYDNFHGKLREFIPNAGFKELEVRHNFWTPMGTVSIISAVKQ
jgi:ubiquinone/menaquinone biosynthesis C-methylase UbiE